ncbi:MAG: ABC transporter ATP-binding protein [Bryobacteraceae bacterium]
MLSGVSLALRPAELTAVVGPNGAGKSTMLSIAAGLRTNYLGSCKYNGREIRSWSRRELARSIAFVPQSLRLDFPFRTEEIVMMGRTPHGEGWFETPEDLAAVERAMLETDTTAFRGRDFRSLSGGERQRVVLASALAQQPRALLLDEPTTFLDLKHQIDMYRLLRDQARAGMLVIAVTHDLNLAAAYADRIIAIDHGRIAADGSPRDVITQANLLAVFGVDAKLQNVDGRSWIAYD